MDKEEKFPTFSEIAVRLLRQDDPRIQVGLFSAKLGEALCAITSDCSEKDWSENKPTFRPDAFRIDVRERELHIYEVEDTNPLSLRKLSQIIDLYWFLDWHHWMLNVHIVDRYGKLTNTLPIQSFDFAICNPAGVNPKFSSMSEQELRERGFLQFATSKPFNS